MHELGITQSIVAICAERAAGRRVLSITVEIGELSAIVADSVRFCFDLVAEGTVVQGAKLEIEETPGSGECRGCGAKFAMHQPYGRCDACGSAHVRVVGGDELKIRQMEVERCAESVDVENPRARR